MTPQNFFSWTRKSLKKELAFHFGEDKADSRSILLFKSFYRTAIHPNLGVDPLPRISNPVLEWFRSFFNFDNPVQLESDFLSAQDGSAKFIMVLQKDGLRVETVLIPEKDHLTLCVSTQVGCAQACRFCQTGRMGLKRHLSAGEIVGQYIAATQWWANKGRKEKITNVVYMGMGEPLDNLDNVIASAAIFCDEQGLFLSHNKVTVSTVGLLPALDTLLLSSRVCIALSLHSPFEDERSRIMPVNQLHSIKDVLGCLKRHISLGSRSAFLIQYTMIRGFNDSKKHALEISKILEGISCKINLIPLNEHEGSSFRRPDLNNVYQFQNQLKELGLVCTVRLSKGRDIQAACGQLINKEKF